MFAVEGYGGGVEEDPQHPHHHQVHRADGEHLEYQKIKINTWTECGNKYER